MENPAEFEAMWIHHEFRVPYEEVLEMGTLEVRKRMAYLKRRADLVNKAQKRK